MCGSEDIVSLFLILTLSGGKWSASRPGRFTAGERPPVPIGQQTGWFPELVWRLWRKEKSLALAGNRTPAVQPVTRRYIDSVIPARWLTWNAFKTKPQTLSPVPGMTLWGTWLVALRVMRETLKYFVLWWMNLTRTILSPLQYCKKCVFSDSNWRC
jgi:hypothetical protein